ncbi:hypothetical protein [Janthinobacterium aquaticum]|uniref:hypothetical protein n=1 Tax=Janthinobacterium sp. FT58W TaxID=2654254 RepID=UPI00186ACF2E|nr:hypothetical protein [Janthinobacterium sp. FT58W]
MHAILIHQHIVMVMDGDELPQITTLDFSFIQHVGPLGSRFDFIVPESSDVTGAALWTPAIKPAPDLYFAAHLAIS